MSVHERFYGQAAQEIERGIRREDLWAKAYVLSAGDAQKAKILYVDLLANLLSESSRKMKKIEVTQKGLTISKSIGEKAFYALRLFVGLAIISWEVNFAFNMISERYAEEFGVYRPSFDQVFWEWPVLCLSVVAIISIISWFILRLLIKPFGRVKRKGAGNIVP